MTFSTFLKPCREPKSICGFVVQLKYAYVSKNNDKIGHTYPFSISYQCAEQQPDRYFHVEHVTEINFSALHIHTKLCEPATRIFMNTALIAPNHPLLVPKI